MSKVNLQLLGQFELSGEKGALDEENLHSPRLMNLLVYLLVYKEHPVSLRKLGEAILEEDTMNPEGTVRNLMYRLRNELKKLGDEKYIVTVSGAYQWNPEVKVETDYDVFEKLSVKLSQRETDFLPADERKELYLRIIRLYNGNITDRVAEEAWIIPKVMRYQKLYLKAVKLLCEIYDEQENWAELETLCSHALRLQPTDEELYCWVIRSLHRQNQIDRAIQTYEYARRTLYESQGIMDLSKLEAAFQEILRENDYPRRDLRDLMEDLQEKERPTGTFFCDYQIFRMMYRVEARRSGRRGMDEYVMLLSLRLRKGVGIKRNAKNGNSEVMDEMKRLEEVVADQLRTGDVATRLGAVQILIMLPGCSKENCEAVVGRIQKNFRKYLKKGQVDLIYEMGVVSMAGMDDDSREVRDSRDGGKAENAG